jgi:hypothetical protein
VPFSLFFEDCFVRREFGGVECPVDPQSPPEGGSADDGGDASGSGVDPRSPAGKSSRGIHHDSSIAGDEPHE